MATNECAICLRKVRRVGYRRCRNGHRYHKSCIGQWLIRRDSCPQCRVPMRTREENEEAENASSDSDTSSDDEDELIQYQTNMNIMQDIIDREYHSYRYLFSDLMADLFEAVVINHSLRRLYRNGERIYTSMNETFQEALQNADIHSTMDFYELEPD